jgi:hypothetical protein
MAGEESCIQSGLSNETALLEARAITLDLKLGDLDDILPRVAPRVRAVERDSVIDALDEELSHRVGKSPAPAGRPKALDPINADIKATLARWAFKPGQALSESDRSKAITNFEQSLRPAQAYPLNRLAAEDLEVQREARVQLNILHRGHAAFRDHFSGAVALAISSAWRISDADGSRLDGRLLHHPSSLA